MHKTKWLDYLRGDKDITELPPKKQVWFRWKIRDEIKKAIDFIIFALVNMDNVTDRPEKEFDLIFKKHGDKTVALLQLVSLQEVWNRPHWPVTIYDKNHNL